MSGNNIEWLSLGPKGGRQADWRSAGTIGFITAGGVLGYSIPDGGPSWWILLLVGVALMLVARYFLDLHDKKTAEREHEFAALAEPEELERKEADG